MSDFSIATLGREGVITDPAKGLNYIMSCFFFSKFSQTVIYKGNVISLSNIIKQAGDDPLQLTRALEESITSLLDRYFKTVRVTVNATSGDSPEISVDLQVSVIPNNGTTKDMIDMGYALTVEDTTFKKIVNQLNNEVLF